MSLRLKYIVCLLCLMPFLAQAFTMTGYVKELDGTTPINGVLVQLIDEQGYVRQETNTSAAGLFVIEFDFDQRYQFKLQKAGYKLKNVSIPMPVDDNMQEFEADLRMEPGISLLEGHVVVRTEDGRLIRVVPPNLEVEAKAKNGVRSYTSKVSEDGRFEMRVGMNGQYELRITNLAEARMKGYVSQMVEVNTFNDAEKAHVDVELLQMPKKQVPAEEEIAKEATKEKAKKTKKKKKTKKGKDTPPTPKPIPELSKAKEQRIQETIEKAMEGKDNIFFYPAGKAKLIPAAQAYLEELAERLKKDRTLRIDIIAHSDEEMERTISNYVCKMRIDEVTQWLISNGVRFDQMVIKVMGFRQPLTKCKANVNCHPKETQLNRRVEFIVNRGS